MRKRTVARTLALYTLFSLERRPRDLESALIESLTIMSVRDSLPEEDDLYRTWNDFHDATKDEVRDFAFELIEGVWNKRAELDVLIEQKLQHWKLSRIGQVEKSILRLSLYEIVHRVDIPYNVAINEAVELAKRYGDEDAGKFINGILGTWAPEGSENS